jgi:O-methyltransferase
MRNLRKNQIYTRYFRPIRVKLLPIHTRINAIKKVIKHIKIAEYVDNAKYIGDGIITTHSIDILKIEEFAHSYTNAFEFVPAKWHTIRDILWRSHIYSWAYNQGKSLNKLHPNADFVELGVWYGILSKAALNMDFGTSGTYNFYLCDPWGEQRDLHKIEKSEKYSDDIFNIVHARFQQYANVKLLRGIVPDILEQIPSEKIAFLSIDMNSSKPERLALEFFWPKILQGGVIYLDDYGDFSDLRNEVNDFLSDKEEKILYFPTGQALIIKS